MYFVKEILDRCTLHTRSLNPHHTMLIQNLKMGHYNMMSRKIVHCWMLFQYVSTYFIIINCANNKICLKDGLCMIKKNKHAYSLAYGFAYRLLFFYFRYVETF